MQRKPTCSSWCGNSSQSFFSHSSHRFILISHQSDDDDKLCDQAQEWTQNESNVSSFDVAHSSLSSHAHLPPTHSACKSQTLQAEWNMCDIYIRKKLFSKDILPSRLPYFFWVYLFLFYFRHFFSSSLLRSVLCCSTFISHFACIKEDTMREKKVLLLSLCLALAVVRRHLYSSIRSDKLKIWNWSTFKMFHFKYVSLNSQTLLYRAFFSLLPNAVGVRIELGFVGSCVFFRLEIACRTLFRVQRRNK